MCCGFHYGSLQKTCDEATNRTGGASNEVEVNLGLGALGILSGVGTFRENFYSYRLARTAKK